MITVVCVLLLQQADSDFFEKKIRPVLAERCYSCHSVASGKKKGGLLLDSRAAILKGGDSGPAAIPGDAEKSLLLRAVRYTEEFKMPPKGKLPDPAIADVADWVRRGLPWPDHADTAAAPTAAKAVEIPWSFRPLRKPVPGWTIDRYVDARLKERGFAPAPPAEKPELLRRATFDLTGLPPTAEELEAFLADSSPGAYERVVDRLLASVHFGERWARHWMDVVRYADSTGFGADYTLDEAWRYRDYLIDAFNGDKPYDEFVREQIAGDLLPTPVPVATGLFIIGPKELAEYDKEKLRMDVVDEQLNTVGQAFLGLTFGCARCHDHKFDPVSARDYYALAGIFRSTRTIPPGNISGPISGWNIRLMNPTPENVKGLADWKSQTAKARAKLVQIRDRKSSAAEARALERMIARTTDEQELQRLQGMLAKKKSAVPPTPEEETRLEAEMVQALMRPKPDQMLAVEDEKSPSDIRIHIRGDVHNLGAPVPRGFLQAIPLGQTATLQGSGRRELAEWITHPDHPLTSRVWVNRIWHHLLGEGLVRTVDNFGARGETPSHPELLDYLAVRLRETGGSLKQMVREIVLTETYRRASRGGSTDPENRLLGRRDRRRLDAESLRDAMLSISGELDPARGGSTMTYTGRLFVPYESSALPVDPWRRRAVYLPLYRGTVLPDILDVFDGAPPGMVTGRRASTTVPTQALFLLNSPFVLDRARAVADSLIRRADLDDRGRLSLLYRKLFAREPSESDLRRARAFLGGRDGWSDLVQALFSSNEFLFVE
jgi:hypothetical protein